MKLYQHYIFDWGDTLMVDFSSETGPMYLWSTVEAVPGARKLLEKLTEFAECSLATNAKDSTEQDIRKALDRVGISSYIKKIFCYQNIGFEKSSIEFFQAISSSLKIKPGKIVVVGDSLQNDVMGALKFGFDAIWYNRTKQNVPEGDITSVFELSQIISIGSLAQLEPSILKKEQR